MDSGFSREQLQFKQRKVFRWTLEDKNHRYSLNQKTKVGKSKWSRIAESAILHAV